MLVHDRGVGSPTSHMILGAASGIGELACLGSYLLLCVCSVANIGSSSIFESNGLINRICCLRILFQWFGRPVEIRELIFSAVRALSHIVSRMPLMVYASWDDLLV
jgi:hypothetical protein